MAISLPQLFDLLVQNDGTEEQQSVENSTVTLHSGHPESHDNIDMDICIDDLFTSVRIPENQAENGDTSGQIDNIMSRIMSLGEASSGQHPKSDNSDVKKENIPSPSISRLSSSELQAEYHVKYTSGSGSNSSNPASPSDFDWKTYYRNMSPLESPWSPLDSPMSSPEARVTHSQDNTVNQFPSPEPLYALQMPTYPGIDPKLVLVSGSGIRQIGCDFPKGKVKFTGDYTKHQCGLLIRDLNAKDRGIWMCEVEKYYTGFSRRYVNYLG